ncbi:sensor histidine kinase [Streptomyces sp. NPDC012888]|uniref:sensor histidine kinase n=1 Tax=Streptomyces sp. NPDC012888 TaxID=3364855 RepID=UPI00367BECEF
MNETTAGGKPRTQLTEAPEVRLAARLLANFQKELLDDAFAHRPMRPLPEDSRAVRVFPRRIRRYAVWLPHAAVVFFSLIVLLFASEYHGYHIAAAVWGLTSFLPVAAVLLTLTRPVAAWWASIGVTSLLAIIQIDSFTWPWAPATFASHIAVMIVVGLRTNRQTTLWMLALTGVHGILLDSFVYNNRGANIVPVLLFSAFVLLAVTVVHVRREAAEEVTAQQEVTAVERDRRTLLEERTTIARELHDVVAHHMSVVAIQAEAAPYRVQDPPPELEAAFATIRENAVAALTELRRVLGVVRSADYEAPDAPQPTLAALDGLLANVREAGLSVEKTVTGAPRDLPQGVELSAYRIIQETLSNTLRHAPGAAAGVELSYVLGGLGLRVVNGPPTGDVRPSPGAGHGITGMRERVAMLEGEMTAGPTGAGGYEVSVFIPVRVVPGGDTA